MDSSLHKTEPRRRSLALLARPFGADLRSLACARIGAGTLLLVDLLLRLPGLVDLYAEAGSVPGATLIGKQSLEPPCSLHLLFGGAWWPALLFAVAAVFASMLLVGWRTRLATVCSWLLLISLHARNPLVIAGGDRFLAILLFWGMWLPWGDWWSVDAVRRGPTDRPTRVLSIATAAILAEVVLLYYLGALLKSGPAWRETHDAIYFALARETESTDLGKALLAYPELLRLSTAGVFWLETAGGLLFLCPFFFGPVRTLTVAAFCGLQLSFLLSLKLGLFPWVNFTLLATLLPSEFWDSRPVRAALGRLERATPGFRASLGRMAAALPGGPAPPLSRRPRWIGEGLAAAALAYVLAYNAWTLDPNRFDIWRPLDRLGSALRINQALTMYAPEPSKTDGWFVIPARLADGRVVDLAWGAEGRPMTQAPPTRPMRFGDQIAHVLREDAAELGWGRPDDLRATFGPTFRHVYGSRAATYRIYQAFREDYVRDALRRWNADHSGNDRATDASAYYIIFTLLPGGGTTPPAPLLMASAKAE